MELKSKPETYSFFCLEAGGGVLGGLIVRSNFNF